MKTVYFVRHAKSSWNDPSLRDIERPLNKRGLRDAPFMGKLMHGKGVAPDALISSPARRAHTTALFFAKALQIKEDSLLVDKRIYDAFPDGLLDIIQELPENFSTVFLFGHNPTLTGLANFFSKTYISNIPTCGVFKVVAAVDDWQHFQKGTATLSEFHYPKQYFD